MLIESMKAQAEEQHLAQFKIIRKTSSNRSHLIIKLILLFISNNVKNSVGVAQKQ